jgi:hypothetical protein
MTIDCESAKPQPTTTSVRQCNKCLKDISKTNWSKHERRCKGKVTERKPSKVTSREYYNRNRDAILLKRKEQREQKAAKALKKKKDIAAEHFQGLSGK